MATNPLGHRVLIASLFLPNTVDLSPHNSPIATPELTSSPKKAPEPLPPIPNRPLPKKKLTSIVDDLAVKAQGGTPLVTPQSDSPNPFASVFPSLAKPALSRTASGTHTRVPSLPRIPFSLTPISHPSSAAPDSIANNNNNKESVTSPSDTTNNGNTERKSRSAGSPLSTSGGLGRRQSRTSRSGVRRSNSFASTGRPGSLDGNHYVLPWEITSSGHGNVGLHKALASVRDSVPDVRWIGVLDTPTDEFSDELKDDVELRLGAENNVPVWVHDAEFHSAYDVFCHQVLWPTLHYAVPDAPKTKVVYESSSFVDYKRVNEQFAETIIAEYRAGDIIWINDYHLCLVPQLVRSKLPDAPIGFFMHVAWPSTEIFRCLAVRQQLLYGLLGSDLLGFQTHNYARHFRQTCSRILSLEALPKGIQLERSFVDVAVFPIGLDIQDLTKKRHEPEVEEWTKSLRQRYEGKKLIVGRDKLDEVSGVRHKVIAFEGFLERYPEFQGQVVLIQVALARTEQNELQASITDVISHVNSRFGSLTYQPVVLLHTQDITFPMYLGLLSAADAFMVTSLREGMALRTHEFVECQHERKRPLILSEFTGSYSYSGFRSCIAINPWDYRNTAQAIHEALTMSDEEANSRWHDLHSHVITQTAQSFVTAFLTRCVRVHTEHVRQNPMSIPVLPLDNAILPKIQTITLSSSDLELVTPTVEAPSQLQQPTSQGQKVLTLIDFESTLWNEDPRVVREHGFVVPEQIVHVLRGLVGQSWNSVWLLSGLPVRKLEKIADAVPGLGLVAENGCFIKDADSTKWTSSVSKISFAWKPICLEILAYFTERTPGSFVEDRDASVVWRFLTDEKDEPSRQWARRQAAEAQNHIWDSLGERFGLRIIPGARSFLVLPKNVSRSTAVGLILSKHSKNTNNGGAGGHDHSSASSTLAFGQKLMASISAAAFWNPTGAVPRPPSPVHTHLHPGTVMPSASFGVGTTGIGTPLASAQGGTSTPIAGAPSGFASRLAEEESDYVHVGYPRPTHTPSASLTSASEFSAVLASQSDISSAAGVESIADSSDTGSSAAPPIVSTPLPIVEPEPENGSASATGLDPVPSSEHPAHREGSLITGTDLPNSMGYVPGFAPATSTTLPLSVAIGSGGAGTVGSGGKVGGSSDFEMILALTGDEPLIRRLNGLEEAQTCTTSGKGSDAMWRLPADQVLGALEKIVNVVSAA